MRKIPPQSDSEHCDSVVEFRPVQDNCGRRVYFDAGLRVTLSLLAEARGQEAGKKTKRADHLSNVLHNTFQKGETRISFTG
jgi:hypothetical protein